MSAPDPIAVEACRQFAEMGGWPSAKAEFDVPEKASNPAFLREIKKDGVEIA